MNKRVHTFSRTVPFKESRGKKKRKKTQYMKSKQEGTTTVITKV